METHIIVMVGGAAVIMTAVFVVTVISMRYGQVREPKAVPIHLVGQDHKS